MRVILVIYFALLLSLNSFAQSFSFRTNGDSSLVYQQPGSNAYEREVNTYDELGHIASKLIYKNNVILGWILDRKEEYTYDVNGQLTYHRTIISDEMGVEWVTDAEYQYEYDDNGNRTVYQQRRWFDNEWISGIRQEGFYNEYNKRDSTYNYTWMTDLDSFQLSGKFITSFDEEGNELWYEQIIVDPSTSVSTPYYRTEYINDMDGQKSSAMLYQWSQDSSSWVPNTRSEYEYSEDGLTLNIFLEQWDTALSSWESNRKDEYVYNTDGRVLYFAWEEWNEEMDAWIKVVENEFSFNANGDLTMSNYRGWSSSINDWFFGSKKEYIFDDNQEYLNRIKQYTWSSDELDWVLDDEEVIYHNIVTTIGEIEVAAVQIFPNPTADYLRVNFIGNIGTFELFDLTGRRLMTKNITGGDTIDLSTLAKGTYMYTILINGEVHTGAMIKQ